MKNGFMSLLEGVAKFQAIGLDLKLAGEGIIAEWCKAVYDNARDAIGTYKYSWPPLSDENS